ncbi:MAG: DNA cytosine methyltransferase [Alphaproteobacteria bacterium]|nr:DNA cytosine methyltransferase [Alphaproteobacteria bacterium]
MPRFAEFFAGIGLVREAIEPLGWECVFANDIAPPKAEMYEARFGPEHLHVGDIHELVVSDIPGGIDLLTASFPCIDLSLAGNRNGLAGRHSGTIWPFLDLANELCRRGDAPSALLLENVTGLLSSEAGRDLRAICERIGSLGYRIDIVKLDAKWFAPQSRPRLFVVALESDLGDGTTLASTAVSAIRPRSVRQFERANGDLPFIDLRLPEPPRSSPLPLAAVLDEVPEEHDTWWPIERVHALVDAMAPRHRERVEALQTGERDGVTTMFRRVRAGRTVGEVRSDRLAGCLRTPYGGSSVQFLVDCRSGEARIRPLNGREYARLQGAGDFPITVGNRQAWLGFGDAVCVPAVRWLVRHAFGFYYSRERPTADLQPRLCEKSGPYAAVA